MKRFSPLCSQWHGQVKHFFTMLHGHQKKVLALFVLGAIKAESIVVQRVAEELLTETEAKVPSIERRLARFVANERIVVSQVWKQFLGQVLPYWHGKPIRLILDCTPCGDTATIVYLGLLVQSRVLPLMWRVMPLQEEWQEEQWQLVGAMFDVVHSHLAGCECTLLADRGLSGAPLVKLCRDRQWHYVLRICKEHTVRRKRGQLGRAGSCKKPSKRWLR